MLPVDANVPDFATTEDVNAQHVGTLRATKIGMMEHFREICSIVARIKILSQGGGVFIMLEIVKFDVRTSGNLRREDGDKFAKATQLTGLHNTLDAITKSVDALTGITIGATLGVEVPLRENAKLWLAGITKMVNKLQGDLQTAHDELELARAPFKEASKKVGKLDTQLKETTVAPKTKEEALVKDMHDTSIAMKQEITISRDLHLKDIKDTST